MTYLRMADAAYAVNIPPGFQIAAGYYYGRADYHTWPASDWGRFPGYRLPISVPTDPGNAAADAPAALAALRALGVPEDSYTGIDVEARTDAAEYVEEFGAILAPFYRVWVYGSVSTVFINPPLNGYWVADYTSNMLLIDQLLQHASVRAVQFAANLSPGYDVSLVKAWTEGGMWHG